MAYCERMRDVPEATWTGVKLRWLYLAVFVVALLLRSLYLAQIRESPLFDALVVDAAEYDSWAQRIAGGDWLGQEVFYQAPLYPYFLGVNYAVFGRDLLTIRIVQILLGSLSCVFLAIAGSRFFSPRAGVVAGLLLAVYPVAIFFDTIIQKSVLDTFFMTLLVCLMGLLLQDRRWGWWLLTGAVLGLLSLTRENALALVPLAWVWIGLHFRDDTWRSRLEWMVLLTAGLLLALLPVGVRNLVVGGEFFITTSQFGSNLYIGNHEHATGEYVPMRWGRCSPEFERLDATELAEVALGRRLSPREVSRYWTGRALDYAARNPIEWLQLMARKWALTWNAEEIVDAEDIGGYAEYSPLLRALRHVMHFGILCPLAALGVVATWQHRDRLWLLYLMILMMAASVAVFYVFARYRFPMVPVLILFAAAGLVETLSMAQQRQWRRLAIGMGAAAVAAVFTNLPLVSEARGRATTHYNLGLVFQERGAMQEAMDQYREALRFKPDFIQVHFNLASALAAVGELPDAVNHYAEAIRLKPDYAEAHGNLAAALDELGLSEAAIAHYRLAVALAPHDAGAHYNLAIAVSARGQKEAAIPHYTEALRLRPDYLEARGNLAILLGQLGQHEQADLQYREGLRFHPDSAPLHYNYAVELAKRGQRKEAIEHLRRTLELEPGFGPARAKLESLLGQHTETRTHAAP
jgi:tetratricopeptide (TPR) repeat protein